MIQASRPKIPIARAPSALAMLQTPRVRHACDECKGSRVKCDGKQPACLRCLHKNRICVYSDGKREKMTKEFQHLKIQVQNYKSLLKFFYTKLDKWSQRRIERALAWGHLADEGQDPGEQLSAAPSGILDYTDEDYNRDELSRSMGFVGQYSERSWMYSLKRDMSQDNRQSDKMSPPETHSRVSATSVSYLLDDLHISSDEDADPLRRPPSSVSDQLMDAYFHVVHPSFPILGKTAFIHQYRQYYSGHYTLPGKKWLAILNLVFAIARMYISKCSGNEVAESDHSDFFSRAQHLGLSGSALLDNPDLQQVQIEGLTAFYLLAVEQVNRSWKLCGIALRSAYAMGLNMRSVSSQVSDTSREIRYRVWWSLYTFEHTLYIMTGRPSCVNIRFCSTPIPLPFPEHDFGQNSVTTLLSNYALRKSFLEIAGFNSSGEQQPATLETNSENDSDSTIRDAAVTIYKQLMPNVSLYYSHFVTLTVIMREAINELYAPGTARLPWSATESIIVDLNSELDAWNTKLPDAFRLSSKWQPSDSSFERQRVSLAFRFYSARIIVNRTALQRMERTPRDASDQTRSMANICVTSALGMLGILPEDPDIYWLISISPWWCLLHYLMQSTTVLLIQWSLELKNGRNVAESTENQLTKTIRWLREMSTGSLAAQRAWTFSSDVFQQLSSRKPLDLSKNIVFTPVYEYGQILDDVQTAGPEPLT